MSALVPQKFKNVNLINKLVFAHHHHHPVLVPCYVGQGHKMLFSSTVFHSLLSYLYNLPISFWPFSAPISNHTLLVSLTYFFKTFTSLARLYFQTSSDLPLTPAPSDFRSNAVSHLDKCNSHFAENLCYEYSTSRNEIRRGFR